MVATISENMDCLSASPKGPANGGKYQEKFERRATFRGPMEQASAA